eukprot:190446-Amphidinium_carterae.1
MMVQCVADQTGAPLEFVAPAAGFGAAGGPVWELPPEERWRINGGNELADHTIKDLAVFVKGNANLSALFVVLEACSELTPQRVGLIAELVIGLPIGTARYGYLANTVLANLATTCRTPEEDCACGQATNMHGW